MRNIYFSTIENGRIRIGVRHRYMTKNERNRFFNRAMKQHGRRIF